MVRNGHLPARKLQTGLGPVTVKIPKVRAKTGEPVTFRSALVLPYVRKTKSLEAALPWLYLKRISSGEIGEALKVLVVPDATGLSAGRVSRLKQVWTEEYRSGCEERLDKDHWVYVWADGVYSGQRAEQTKLCALVVIGVNERGEKHFLAIEDGVRESTRTKPAQIGKQSAVKTEVTRRRCYGLLGCTGGSVSRDASAALLDAQDHERAKLPAKVSLAESEAGTA